MVLYKKNPFFQEMYVMYGNVKHTFCYSLQNFHYNLSHQGAVFS